MKYKEFNNVIVSGIACAVPKKYVETDSYTEYFGKNVVERFKKATGINGRYLSDGRQTASDLSFVAAEGLMKKKGITGEDIDAVVFITQTPDYYIPSTAYILHKRLGIKKDCMVFDVNLGCSGHTNGIYFLAGLIESGTINRALLLVGDSHTDREVSDNTTFTMMFGDASSATILERGDGIVRGMIRSDGEGFRSLITPVPGARFPEITSLSEVDVQCKMNGDEIFSFAITKVSRLFNEFFECFRCSLDDYDYFVLHQANKMIIDQIAKKLKLSETKVPISLDRYGNTDGASIPVTIVNLCEKFDESRTLKLITSGFGLGLSWAIVSFEINSDDVMPMIITDDYYEDGRNV